MDRIVIYPPNGLRPLCEVPMTKAAKLKNQLMGEYYIEIPFTHNDILDIPRGCFISYNDSIYFLKKDATPEPLVNSDGYKYVLKFYAQQHLMEDCVFKWLTGSKEITFNLTATLDDYASLLAKNMSTYIGSSSAVMWTYKSVSAQYQKTTKGLSFNGVSCWQAATYIAKEFGVEWWVEEVYSASSKALAICFGKLTKGADYEEIREGEIVNRYPSAKRGEDENYGTRFFVFGGTRNIPEDYENGTIGGVVNHISEKRLHLPNGQEYIDVVDGLSGPQIIERTIILDDVFPNNTDEVTEVIESEQEVIEGESNKCYAIKAANSTFLKTQVIGTLGATFTSGALNGRDFDLRYGLDSQFEIIPQIEGVDGADKIAIPNEYLKPEVGDTFILTGVRLSEDRVKSAEDELLEKGLELARQYHSDTNVYECSTNAVYCTKNNINYALGQKVKLIGAQFGTGRLSRIQGYEKTLYNEYEATYTIGDNSIYSKFSLVAQRVDNIKVQLLQSSQQKISNTLTPIKLAANNASALIPRVTVLEKRADDNDQSITEIEASLDDTIQMVGSADNTLIGVNVANINNTKTAIISAKTNTLGNASLVDGTASVDGLATVQDVYDFLNARLSVKIIS